MVRILILSLLVCSAFAQEKLPEDNTEGAMSYVSSYHPSPNYRESESHPLRIVSYALHPIGWALREYVFRPFSYFVSSTPLKKSVFGYRDPYDFRKPSCFSSDSSTPDCRTLSPYNYVGAKIGKGGTQGAGNSVYLPDVNFDFNNRGLNDLGKGRVHEINEMLKTQPNVNIILEGHTDVSGSDNYNNKLGLNRSESVKAELVKLGVEPARLSTVTFGESQLKSQDPTWGSAVNRRVAVKLDR